jgi:hypothetical protein
MESFCNGMAWQRWFQFSFSLECRSMGFCTEECRNEYYFLDYRYRLTMAMEAEGRRFRSEARKAPVAEGEAANGYSIFFTSAEVESFP